MQREQAEATIAAERRAREEVEERAKRYALDGELGRALASQPLAVGAADHLTKILRDEFQVTPQGNSFLVQSKDFRSVGDYLGTLLGRPEYACFLRPQNAGGGTGGASATQAAPTTPANPAAAQQPRNMGEAILMSMAQRSQDAPPANLTGGSVVTEDGKVQRQGAAAFGLRPTSPTHWTDRQRRA